MIVYTILLLDSYIYLLCYSLNIMLSVSFSLARDRACRHCWISSFWTPIGKRRLYFSRGPLFKPLWQGIFWNFHQNKRKSSNMFFCSNLFALRQETFADVRDGDGGGWVDYLGSFGTILEPLLDHFRTTLDSC